MQQLVSLVELQDSLLYRGDQPGNAVEDVDGWVQERLATREIEQDNSINANEAEGKKTGDDEAIVSMGIELCRCGSYRGIDSERLPTHPRATVSQANRATHSTVFCRFAGLENGSYVYFDSCAGAYTVAN